MQSESIAQTFVNTGIKFLKMIASKYRLQHAEYSGPDLRKNQSSNQFKTPVELVENYENWLETDGWTLFEILSLDTLITLVWLKF